AAALLGTTTVAWLSGPLRAEILGVALSVRTLSRPMVAVLVVLAIRAWLLRASPPGHARGAGLAVVSRVALGSVVAAGLVGWLAFRSPTVGGSDSYGYVSAADRLLAGRLVQDEPLARILPFPNAITAAVPFGYVPASRVAHASAPAFPLGLPALMAVAKVAVGPQGPFLVSLIMGVWLLVASSWTAWRWTGDRETALLTAALVAINPVVFTYAIQPMSDVPAAALIVSAVAAWSHVRPMPVTAGVCAALAIAVRPALAPAVLALALWPVLLREPDRRRLALRFLGPVAGGIGLMGLAQWYLYGDLRASGYGAVAGLFSVAHVGLNLRIYGLWGWLALGPLWVGAVAIGLVISSARARAMTLLIAAGVSAPYLVYRPYDHWETLRFLLPAIAVATVVAASGLGAVARRVAVPQAGGVLAAGLVLMVATLSATWMSAQQVFTMPVHEARYRLAGEMVAQVTPPTAVILAAQHSGSVRYYAGRRTVNWQGVPRGTLPATVRALQAQGARVFLLIDSQVERRELDLLHGWPFDGGEWLPAGQRRDVQLLEAPPDPGPARE
ncbi:MAG: hypothetical protein ACT4QD_18715, partial [Acidobacteriota bacterium]